MLGRLHALPQSTRSVLGAAAVLGRRFDRAELSAMTGTPPAEVTAALRDAASASIVVDAGGRPEFRHDLVRDAVYHDLPDARRRALHRQAVAAVGPGRAPARAAEHLLIGAEPEHGGAVGGLVDVARRLAGPAPLTAVRLLERALALTPANDQNVAAGDGIIAALAPLLVEVGRGPEAERLTRELLARRPPPALEGVVRRALGLVLWTKGWLEASVVELEAAAAVEGTPAIERLDALALAANLRLFLGDPGTARDRAEWALAEAGRAGDDFAACLALQTLALAADADGHVKEAVDLARRATELAEQSPEARVGQLHAHLVLGLVLFDADRLDEAEAVLQEGRRRSEERGTVAWLPLYHCALALRCLLIGSLDDGLAEVDAGMAVADEVGTRLYVPLLHGMAAWVAVQRDELDVARARMEAAATEFLRTLSESWQAEAGQGFASAEARWPLEWGLWVSALIHEAEGDVDQARAVLEDAWGLATPLRYFLGHRIISPDLVRLTSRRGDRPLAKDVVATLEEGARRAGTASAIAAALRAAGLLDDDPDLLVAAAETYRRAPQLMELAHTLEDAGRSLAGHGRTKEAARHLEQALELFETAGSTRPSTRVRGILDSLGVGRSRPARARPAGGWDSLTPTELKVAALVAEGLTNRQIGERLFVSRRTVETHVAHSFAKLGLSTRAQLAAEVTRRA